jgi:hypothetical protein
MNPFTQKAKGEREVMPLEDASTEHRSWKDEYTKFQDKFKSVLGKRNKREVGSLQEELPADQVLNEAMKTV